MVSAPIHALQEFFFLSVVHKILFLSQWLLFHKSLIKTTVSREREMNSVNSDYGMSSVFGKKLAESGVEPLKHTYYIKLCLCSTQLNMKFRS